MSFLSKALRRAEVFLEQVDESVAQASRRMVIEGATGDVDDSDGAWAPSGGDPAAITGVDVGMDVALDETAAAAAHAPPRQRRRGLANIRRADRFGDAAAPPPAKDAAEVGVKDVAGAGLGSRGEDTGDGSEKREGRRREGVRGAGSGREVDSGLQERSAGMTQGAAEEGDVVCGQDGADRDADGDDGWGTFDFPADDELAGPAAAGMSEVGQQLGVPGLAAGGAVASEGQNLADFGNVKERSVGSRVDADGAMSEDGGKCRDNGSLDAAGKGISKGQVLDSSVDESGRLQDGSMPILGKAQQGSATDAIHADELDSEKRKAILRGDSEGAARSSPGRSLASPAFENGTGKVSGVQGSELSSSMTSQPSIQSGAEAVFSTSKSVASADGQPASEVIQETAAAERSARVAVKSTDARPQSDEPALQDARMVKDPTVGVKGPSTAPLDTGNASMGPATGHVRSSSSGRRFGTGSSTSKDAETMSGSQIDEPAVASSAPHPSDADSEPARDGAEMDQLGAVMQENEELRKELEYAEEDFEDMMKEKAKYVANLKSLKEVMTEMEESLEEKSSEVRRLGQELIDMREEKNTLAQRLRESNAKGKDALDLREKEHVEEVSALRDKLHVVSVERDGLSSENAGLKDAMAQGREVDMATADDARDLATRAQSAYEREVEAHRETREDLKRKQEALDAESAVTADALAAMQRKADEALSAASEARSAQRMAESKLGRVSSARDAALARVEDLTKELAPYKTGEDGQPPGREELASLQQTVSELENALAAKNVELTRLEGEVENMRRVLDVRNDPSSARSPGAGSSDGYEVEQKLRHMADSALRKQAQIEVLRSENKVLQTQLDTERKRTREAQAMAAVATSSRHTLRGGFRGILDVGDEERGERPHVVREGPMARFRIPRGWPTAVTKFVGSLDKLSAQALSFLRKEPLVRIALLVYMVLMHVLVYGLLHFHVESTLGSDTEGGIHAHPHHNLVPQGGHKQMRS